LVIYRICRTHLSHDSFLPARFDVKRSARDKFTVGTVVKTDLSGKVKRIKFHFRKTHADADEWIEFGSSRIAPLFSKVVPKAAKKRPPEAEKKILKPEKKQKKSAEPIAKPAPANPKRSDVALTCGGKPAVAKKLDQSTNTRPSWLQSRSYPPLPPGNEVAGPAPPAPAPRSARTNEGVMSFEQFMLRVASAYPASGPVQPYQAPLFPYPWLNAGPGTNGLANQNAARGAEPNPQQLFLEALARLFPHNHPR
jgi:hypothetical protein